MSNQLNDTVHDVLKAEGYTGSLDDMLAAWLISEGAAGLHINTLWAKYFDLKSIPAGQHDDRMVKFYQSEGAVGGSHNDLALDYWKKRRLT